MLQVIEPSPAPAVATIETTLFDDLDAAARDARGALDRAAQPSLYARLDWLRLTREHVLPGSRLVAARARVGEHGAWLFLRHRGFGRACAFAGWYTLAVAPVFTPGTPPGVRLRLLRSLAHALRGFHRIDLAPIEDAAAAELRDSFRAMGWRVIERDETANWSTRIGDRGFDAYWAERPSKLRNTVRRRLGRTDLTTRILDRFDPHAWAAYEDVYAGSWKPAEGAPAFLRALARIEGAAGTLRLGLAFRGDRPVAGQFWTVGDGVAVIHKLAYLETERACSPGTVLSHAMFRNVIEHDRPAMIDYGNGDEPYKADWMTERRVLRRVSLFNMHTLGGLAEAAGASASAFARSMRHG